MQTLDTYFESLKNPFFSSSYQTEVAKSEKEAMGELLKIISVIDLEALLNYTIHHGCPPYGYRITYPLRFLAKNINYVKAVYSIHSKGE